MDKNIDRLKKGTKFVNIVSAVMKEQLTFLNTGSDEYLKMKCVKFIPASGAATRMFEDLYKYLDDRIETESIKTFFDDLEKFAFYEDIEVFLQEGSVDKNSIEGKFSIIEYILHQMNYGLLPKALIKMNSYKGYSTTPIDEHLYEGERYLNPNKLYYHFTISNMIISHE